MEKLILRYLIITIGFLIIIALHYLNVQHLHLEAPTTLSEILQNLRRSEILRRNPAV
jgi:hypothetical protein